MWGTCPLPTAVCLSYTCGRRGLPSGRVWAALETEGEEVATKVAFSAVRRLTGSAAVAAGADHLINHKCNRRPR